MVHHSDVPPSTVGIELREEGVVVEYLDDRTTLYRGVPEKVSGELRAAPGKQTHVLVTDPTESEGVMVYVNDVKTHDEILEDSGVGRVVLRSNGDEEELFPGVTIRRDAERIVVDADPEVARGRVFAFVEDDWSEASYEIVSEEEDEGDDESSTESTDDEGSTESADDAASDES